MLLSNLPFLERRKSRYPSTPNNSIHHKPTKIWSRNELIGPVILLAMCAQPRNKQQCKAVKRWRSSPIDICVAVGLDTTLYRGGRPARARQAGKSRVSQDKPGVIWELFQE